MRGKVQSCVGLVTETKSAYKNQRVGMHTIRHKNTGDPGAHMLPKSDPLAKEAARLLIELKCNLETADDGATESERDGSSDSDVVAKNSSEEVTPPKKRKESDYNRFQSAVMKRIKTSPTEDDSSKERFKSRNSRVAEVMCLW